MSGRRIIFDTGSRKLYVEKNESEIKIVNVLYPIYPYGNNVRDVIKVDREKVEYYTVRDSWNGTGCDSHGYVEITSDEYEKLVNTIDEMKTLDDFNKLIELFNQLKNDREQKLNQIIDELKNIVIDVINTSEIIERYNKLSDDEKRKLVEETVNQVLEYLYS